jgi:hypothetical protein
MWRLDRRVYATLALIILASLVDAQGEPSHERHEPGRSERELQAARWQAQTRQTREAHRTSMESHAAARPQVSYAHARSAQNYHRAMVARSVTGGGGVRPVSRGVRVVRYGNALSGTVERTIRPGLVSRTFVSGGRVLYTHVYQSHVWHHFGRAFAYQRFVPAVRYPAVYYAWALAAWPRPVAYTWGWQVQPWYPMYGILFTPYPVYTSPDLWMTDYIIAQNMQTAYAAQTVAPASQLPPEGTATAAPNWGVAAPAGQPSYTAPGPQPSYAQPPPQPNDAQPPPQWSETPPAPQSSAPPAPQPSDAPAAPVSIPPAITPQIKAQLDAEIKVQLQEQQVAAAMPATLTTQSAPPALRPNHVFFEVVEPLNVPTGVANRYCSLSPSDYIKRTGAMSNDDWMIPVVVELSGPSDCPQGLQTRIGLNDLNAMENEQEAEVMQAMQAASKSMGPNGPPSGPGVHPTLIADGNAASDPSALDAIRQTQ